MAKPRVLLTEEVGYGIIERLEKHFELQLGKRAQFDKPKDIIRNAHPDTEGVLAMLSNGFTAPVLQALPKLKIITNNAVGYNNIDTKACSNSGIIVTNTPDVLTNATADGALSLMLATVRNIPASDQYVRMGKFDGWHPTVFCGLELNGASIGIYGMGRIGLAIAKRAAAFGMNIFYTNRKAVDAEIEQELGATYISDIEELAHKVDVLMLSCPLTEQTFHTVDRSVLKALGADGYLINIARGPVIDEAALVEALQNEEIQGAGLDVFEEEPTITSYLMKSYRCVLTPHIASATHKTRSKMLEMCTDALIAALVDKKLDKVANRVA